MYSFCFFLAGAEEKITKGKLIGNLIIVVGVLIYTMPVKNRIGCVEMSENSQSVKREKGKK